MIYIQPEMYKKTIQKKERIKIGQKKYICKMAPEKSGTNSKNISKIYKNKNKQRLQKG